MVTKEKYTSSGEDSSGESVPPYSEASSSSGLGPQLQPGARPGSNARGAAADIETATGGSASDFRSSGYHHRKSASVSSGLLRKPSDGGRKHHHAPPRRNNKWASSASTPVQRIVAVARGAARALPSPRLLAKLLLLPLLALAVWSAYRYRKQPPNPQVFIYDNLYSSFRDSDAWPHIPGLTSKPHKFSPYRTDSVNAKMWLEGSMSVAGSASATPQDPCWVDVAELAKYNLTSRFLYTRRFIKPTPSHDNAVDARRKNNPDLSVSTRALDVVPEKLFPQPQWLSAKADGSSLLPLDSCDTQPLALPTRMEPPPTGKLTPASLIFGMSTDAGRLDSIVPSLATWLGGSAARLIAIIPPDARVQDLRFRLAQYGINAIIYQSEDAFLDRYMALIQAFHKERNEETKWVAILDDDTTFPSGLPLLMNHLSRHDHNQPLYIGAPSEDLAHFVRSGYMAYGGGGIFLSRELARQLHEAYPRCIEEHREPDGDLRISRCIFQYTPARLHVDYDIHQTDLFDDVSGLLESGDDVVTLHHWKTWYRLDVAKMASAGALCDGACNLQRWQFKPSSRHHSTVVLTNGFSINLYPRGVDPDFSRMEQTWRLDWADSTFDHALGPLRPALTEGKEKFSYRLEDVVRSIGRDGERLLRQIYIRRASPEELMHGGKDGVIELVWIGSEPKPPQPPVPAPAPAPPQPPTQPVQQGGAGAPVGVNAKQP